MEIDIFSEDSQVQQDETTLSDLLNKTKTQPTRFFTELNRHQKMLSRKKLSQSDYLKQSSVKNKKKKGIPTFKEMMMDSKFNLQNEKQHLNLVSNEDIENKKKVRFDSPKRISEDDKKGRKTSIKKTSTFNFYETIKQMALFLAVQKKNGSFANEDSSQRERKDEDLFTGYTKKEFQDGTKFKGICENGVIIKGQLHFQNGFIYDGEFFLDKFHGKGKLTFPKGQTIQADWIEGEILGKATIKYPKGQIFYGDVKDFKRHGQGYLFFNDGSKYEGQFNEGQLTGYGVHTTVTNEKTEGYWFYGDFIGTDQQVFENVMSNAAAHENKKSQKLNKNIKFSKGRNSRNSKHYENLLAELIMNINKLSLLSKTSSSQG